MLHAHGAKSLDWVASWWFFSCCCNYRWP